MSNPNPLFDYSFENLSTTPTDPNTQTLAQKWTPSHHPTNGKPTFSPKPSSEWNPYEMSNIQTYLPLYSKINPITPFSLNSQITLSTFHTFHDLNTISVHGQLKPIPMFIKFSPLLDPLRYLTGKYGGSTSEYPLLKELPTPNPIPETPFQKATNKIYDPNNVSYVDGFFYYLSSQLMHHHSFLHGIDFYGSFLSVQKKFRINLYDDISYLRRYSYFNHTFDKSYHIYDQTFLKYLEFEKKKGEGRSSRKHHKVKLDISSVTDIIENSSNNHLDLLGIEDLSCVAVEDEPINNPLPHIPQEFPETLDINNSLFSSPPISSSSKISDKSSSSEDEEDTEPEEDDDDESEPEEDNTENDQSEEDDDSECPPIDDEENEILYTYIDDFPVQMICMESCEGTLDQLFVEQIINPSNYDTEGASMLFQVVATLATYQKAFHFTHNDLHTNNIMWIYTPITHIYYRIQNRIFRIPTYHRIYKIIDFGRAIYESKGQRFCSDSFTSPEGDASTQYNCEPYLVPNKPVIEPNPSFDLCRLACAIYDFVMDPDISDDEDEEEDPESFDKDLHAESKEDEEDDEGDSIWDDEDSVSETQFTKTIIQWCEDDKGKNMLYRKSGRERYPCFKLYQMIARTVHRHIPIEQIHNPLFTPFLSSLPKKFKKNEILIDIDNIPDYSL